jgi:hypothetical protein
MTQNTCDMGHSQARCPNRFVPAPATQPQNTIFNSLMFVLCTQYCAGDKIKKNEMGGACIMDGGELCTGFWWGTLKDRDHWGDQGTEGRIILRWIFRKWDVGVWTESGWLRIETGGGHL